MNFGLVIEQKGSGRYRSPANALRTAAPTLPPAASPPGPARLPHIFAILRGSTRLTGHFLPARYDSARVRDMVGRKEDAPFPLPGGIGYNQLRGQGGSMGLFFPVIQTDKVR